ncbi:MAG: T9SS type A sorting domain-containing protein [Cyclobacteriaceae bacterium]|nr:T9SS type A sorting domain-containing protein [Cyclobacteriaceae bacterium]
MNKITSLIFFLSLFFIQPIFSQEYLKLIENGETDFNKIKETFYKEWEENGKKISDLKRYERWQYMIESYVVDGKIPQDIAIVRQKAYEESIERQSRIMKSSRFDMLPPWRALPRNSDYNDDSYAGRITDIEVNPQNPQQLYVSSPSGGLWTSLDHGINWRPLTDKFGTLNISDIFIDHEDPLHIIVSTGDESFDGGLTWQKMNWNPGHNYGFLRLDVNPSNGKEMVLYTWKETYFSEDGGKNWIKTLDSAFQDLVRNPKNPNHLYGFSRTFRSLSHMTIFTSTSGGREWEERLIPRTDSKDYLARTVMAMSASNDSLIYILCSKNDGNFGGLWTVETTFDSVKLISNSPNILARDEGGINNDGQGNYDLAIAVDPENFRKIHVGGINIWESENGGAPFSWKYKYSNRRIHVDIHILKFMNNKLYIGSDGGIDMSNKNFDYESVQSLSKKLEIGQIYRLGIHPTKKDVVSIGLQDNGTFLSTTEGNWKRVGGGDGTETAFSRTDSSLYTSSQYGVISNYNFNTNTQTTINIPEGESGGAWVTPFVVDPSLDKTLYIGYKQIWKTVDNGKSMERLSHFEENELITILKQHPFFTRNMIAVKREYLYISFSSFSSFKKHLYFLKDGLSDISFDPNNPDILYCTTIGSSQVFMSTDKGNTWINISQGLPSVLLRRIISLGDCKNTLVVGTDIGVFYKNKEMDSWEKLGEGLPNVIVNDIEYQESSKTLYIATWGRGTWAMDLSNQMTDFFDIQNTGKKVYGDPAFQIQVVTKNGNPVDITSKDNSILYILNDSINIRGAGFGILELTAHDGIETCHKIIGLKIEKANQDIYFPDLRDRFNSELLFALEAEASSGLQIEYNSSPKNILKIENSVAYIYGTGNVTVTASQKGDYNYYPAELSKSMIIYKDSTAKTSVYPNPVVNNGFYISLPKYSERNVVCIYSINGQIIKKEIFSNQKEEYFVNISDFQKGLYFVKINNEFFKLLKIQ